MTTRGNYVIAGGSRGIGRAIVQRLQDTAEQINVYSRTVGDLPTTGPVRFHACDFTSSDVALDDLPDVIHGAIYCPGSINLRSFRGLKPDDFRQDFELNLVGAVRFLQACFPGLKKGSDSTPSSVVLFSTVAVGRGLPMHASVAAAKGAVEGLVRSLAAEWAPQIRVNGLAPALTDTTLAEKLLSTPEKREAMSARYPLARIGTANDLAAAACFLLDSSSSWVTGQIVGVDGGMSTLTC